MVTTDTPSTGMTKLLRKLLHINPWHFVWIIILAAEIITFILNAIQSILRWGYVSPELLQIGTIDALIASLLISPVVIYSLKAVSDTLKQEIAERRLVEEALREAEATARILLDTPTAAAFLLSPQGICLAANETLARRFGRSVPGIVGKSIWDLFPPDVGKRRREHFESVLREKKQERFMDEREGLWSDAVSTPILDDQGEVVKVAIFAFDVTPRILAEKELLRYRTDLEQMVLERTQEISALHDQLRQSQKLEAVGLLAGGIAHDFSNIMTTITGAIYLMQRKLEADSPLVKYVEQIRVSANRANNLSQSLLSFSRKQIVILQPLSLNRVVENIAALLNHVIGEHIRLELLLTRESSAVMADNNQMEQVLLNLAMNSRDAMTDNGTLTIRTEKTVMDDTFIRKHGYGNPGKYVLLSVSDTGTGMGEGIRDKVFEPFFTTKPVGKGSGLGLAVIYGIVRQHKGYIAFETAPGEGTTFMIYLPAADAATIQSPPDEAPGAPEGKEAILLAEDDRDTRRTMSEVLRTAGYTVIEAGDGEEAVAVFSANSTQIDLVFLDVRMPKKNGREVCEEIRAGHPRTKILFTSGYTDDIIDSQKFLGRELNFISKTAQPAQILRKIREVLDTGP